MGEIMAGKKKVEEKKAKASLKKNPPKPRVRKPTLVDKRIGYREITSHEIFSPMEFKIPVVLAGLSGDSLAKQVVAQMNPMEVFTDAVRKGLAPLLHDLNEIRTQECIAELELNVVYEANHDGDTIELQLHAKVNPKGQPDLPYMTGKMAKQLLETAFDRFDVAIDLENGEPQYVQETKFFYEAPGGNSVVMDSVLPTKDVRDLYVNAVHQLYLQMLEGNVLEFYTAHDVHVTPEALEVMTAQILKEHHRD